jgi:predicted peroxiredoxin
MKRKVSLLLILLLLISVVGAGCHERASKAPGGSARSTDSTVLLSVTSDAQANPQAVDMAMKLAGFSLDEGRRVVMFFNVKGVTIPVTGFPEDFAFQENSPIRTQLSDLIERGVDVHVCPICMKALSVEESDLIEGAKVTTRASLFANIGSETSVFTY